MTIWNGNKDMNRKYSDNVPYVEDEIYTTEHSEKIFIDTLQSRSQLVQVFLLGGIRIVGVIVGNDDYTIAINTRSHGVQLVYKNAITTISKHVQEDRK